MATAKQTYTIQVWGEQAPLTLTPFYRATSFLIEDDHILRVRCQGETHIFAPGVWKRIIIIDEPQEGGNA